MAKILVTGGNGFLGRGILRRSRREHWPHEIATMSRDEAKQVKVQGMFPGTRTIKGDVSDDVDYLARILDGFDIVIHAGSNKLVDVGERSAIEVVKNNIVGSEHLAKAAIKAGVKQVIGISSDKAVQPVNVYGMSKAVMERIFQEADTLSPTQFVCARYGNVVGSTISIFLYFRDQLRDLGHIKVTDPRMTRFYMGVDEAIDVILYSMNAAKRGAVVIPMMQGMSVNTAARMALNITDDIPLEQEPRITIVGHRPGEKVHESLLHYQESVRIDPVATSNYYELRPATEPAQHSPFEITSDKPPKGWMSPSRMKELLEDAAQL